MSQNIAKGGKKAKNVTQIGNGRFKIRQKTSVYITVNNMKLRSNAIKTWASPKSDE